jgi:alpha-tubulin suppressor-like RCC1 family protein
MPSNYFFTDNGVTYDFDDVFIKKSLFLEQIPLPPSGGTLWTWGYNQDGQLGDGTMINKTSPIRIGNLTDWKLIAVGGGGAIKDDGTLWTWGYNYFGQLGDGTTINKSSPIQIGYLTDWSQLIRFRHGQVAIKTDGSLWGWGLNAFGVLSDQLPPQSSSPIQIGSLTDWKQVSVVDSHIATIKNDGTLWTWGYNYKGQLGIGTGGWATEISSPTQVGLLTNWKQVACGWEHTVAIKTDGTLWAWGSNDSGQLGDGTTISKSSPIQVSSLTDWKQIVSGYNMTAAIKTDGTLWTWGYGGADAYGGGTGQLGDGTIVSKSSPVQIGLLTNWKLVACGFHMSTAIKTDGTLWTWGDNYYGQLGDGTNTSKSSPVQVGALTIWTQAASGICTSAITF